MNSRKLQFVEELMKVMQTVPYSKASISDLCINLNCSRQSFYYYFDTLDDCLIYAIKVGFKNGIKDEYLISDIFSYIEKNYGFVKSCEEDYLSSRIFWDTLTTYAKRIMDFVLSHSVAEYLSLYADQKEVIVSFYVAGIVEQARAFVKSGMNQAKEKLAAYCKFIIGSADDTKNMIQRFTR